MSTKSARPVKTKQENLFDKVKTAVSDMWDTAAHKAEDLKEVAEDKIEDIKKKVSAKKAPAARKPSAAKQLVRDTAPSLKKAKVNSADVKITAAMAATQPKAESVVKKINSKKATTSVARKRATTTK